MIAFDKPARLSICLSICQAQQKWKQILRRKCCLVSPLNCSLAGHWWLANDTTYDTTRTRNWNSALYWRRRQEPLMIIVIISSGIGDLDKSNDIVHDNDETGICLVKEGLILAGLKNLRRNRAVSMIGNWRLISEREIIISVIYTNNNSYKENWWTIIIIVMIQIIIFAMSNDK